MDTWEFKPNGGAIWSQLCPGCTKTYVFLLIVQPVLSALLAQSPWWASSTNGGTPCRVTWRARSSLESSATLTTAQVSDCTVWWAQTVAEWITDHYFEMIWWCFLRLLSIYVLCALLVWQQWCVLLFCLISNMHTAWEVAGEYVYTTPGDQDTDFLMLMLSVPGYRWSQIFL